jgi:SNF2 family DNA or RNA helicase
MMVERIIPKKKTRLFALILTQNRTWGTILLPYIIVNEIYNKYLQLSECLSPYPYAETISNLTSEERETIKLINDYSDRNLFKLFSKDKNVKEFLEKVTPDKLENHIKPFIESRIYKCLSIARDEGIPVYSQKSKISNLHAEDLLGIHPEFAHPVFRFIRNEVESTYSLKIELDGEKINIANDKVEVLSNSPCLIKEGNNIIFITDIEGSKLKPFFTRDFIHIPKNSELKYYSGFVLNTINNYKVEGEGFEIIESDPQKEAILIVENGIKGYPVLILKFRYINDEVFANENCQSFTYFNNEKGRFVFNKFHRDFDWEKRCRDILEELGFYSEDEVNFTVPGIIGSRKEEIYNLIETINKNYDELIATGFKLKEGSLDSKYNFKPVNIEISHKVLNDWFDLQAIVKIGPFEIPFVRFKKHILEGIREYILPDKSLAILPEQWFSRYKNIFEFGKSSDDSLKIHKQHFSLLKEAFDETGSDIYAHLEKMVFPEQIEALPQPKGLKAVMRPYQSEGFNWMYFLQSVKLGGCLADDMGLGKTIQTLALLQYNRENLDGKNVIVNKDPTKLFDATVQKFTSLIIVPASLLHNWENEIKKYVPEMNTCCYKGNMRKKSTSYFCYYDIILSSYHTIRQDIDIISTFDFHYIILDESQVIKNPASRVYKTVVRLRSDFKLVLSGTPIENSLTDLWTQLNFVNPGLLGNLNYFRKEFAKPIEKMNADDKELKLRKIIQPFILRRTKEMVAKDLPSITEQTVFCDMTEEQANIYEQEKSVVRNSILENIEALGIEKSAILVLQGLMKLRQISNHPVMANDDYTGGSGKFETVLQNMENVITEGHKILVFSSFVKHLDLYAEVFRKKRIKFSMLTGSSTNREKIVNSFQLDPLNKIFLISLKAGGLGLNLTAADYVFILDPWWNPAAEMQALNRAHRIGQDKSVFVYRYISSESIEEKIVKLQENKSRLADTFISSNNPLKDINIKQILEIIG